MCSKNQRPLLGKPHPLALPISLALRKSHAGSGVGSSQGLGVSCRKNPMLPSPPIRRGRQSLWGPDGWRAAFCKPVGGSLLAQQKKRHGGKDKAGKPATSLSAQPSLTCPTQVSSCLPKGDALSPCSPSPGIGAQNQG